LSLLLDSLAVPAAATHSECRRVPSDYEEEVLWRSRCCGVVGQSFHSIVSDGVSSLTAFS
jgi:hypothetical protein